MATNSNQIDPSTMPPNEAGTVFRLRKGYRNIGLVCLPFFVLAGVASAYGIWSEVPPHRPVNAICFVICSMCVWAFMAGLSLWVLLAYWRERLKITGGQVIHHGVIGKKEIDLADVTDVRWGIVKTGRITLRTLTEKLKIDLDNFEATDRLRLIRFVRDRLPDTVQQEWDMFCYKIAIPLRDRYIRGNRPPGPDEVSLTRRRWDWYFIPTILACAVIGVVLQWKLQRPGMLVAPLMPTLLWIFLRFRTPRQGFVLKRISAEPGQTSFLLFGLWWYGIAIAGFVLLKLWNPPMPQALTLGIIGSILWFGGLLYRAYQFDRARRHREREAAKAADQRWNEQECRGAGHGKTQTRAHASPSSPRRRPDERGS